MRNVNFEICIRFIRKIEIVNYVISPHNLFHKSVIHLLIRSFVIFRSSWHPSCCWNAFGILSSICIGCVLSASALVLMSLCVMCIFIYFIKDTRGKRKQRFCNFYRSVINDFFNRWMVGRDTSEKYVQIVNSRKEFLLSHFFFLEMHPLCD